jgi:hypothetical protein
VGSLADGGGPAGFERTPTRTAADASREQSQRHLRVYRHQALAFSVDRKVDVDTGSEVGEFGEQRGMREDRLRQKAG